MNNFKTLERLKELIKLYESQGDPNAEGEIDDSEDLGAEEIDGGDESQDIDGEQQPDPMDAQDNPEAQANPEDGIFISDIKKAEFAKLLINALMNAVPEPGTVPQDMLNVNVENADTVIDYVQNLLNLDGALSTDNESNESGFANAVKEI